MSELPGSEFDVESPALLCSHAGRLSVHTEQVASIVPNGGTVVIPAKNTKYLWNWF